MKKRFEKEKQPKNKKPMKYNWRVVVNGGPDGEVQLFGVNIFKAQWESTGESVELEVRPGTIKKLDIYKTKIGRYEYLFAAAEVSMCVWVFALPN